MLSRLFIYSFIFLLARFFPATQNFLRLNVQFLDRTIEMNEWERDNFSTVDDFSTVNNKRRSIIIGIPFFWPQINLSGISAVKNALKPVLTESMYAFPFIYSFC